MRALVGAAVLVASALAGCGDEPAPPTGIHLALRYALLLPDGRVADSNRGDPAGPLFRTTGFPEPLPFAADPADLDAGLGGLRPGERRRIPISGGRAVVVEAEALPGPSIAVLREGRGAPARLGTRVTVRLVLAVPRPDGLWGAPTVEAPVDVPLTRAEGWLEGILRGVAGMRPGEVRRLEIPAALGYGRLGWPPEVPPDADLEAEVELLAVR